MTQKKFHHPAIVGISSTDHRTTQITTAKPTSSRQLEASGRLLSVNGIAVAHIDAEFDAATAAQWAQRLATRDNAHDALTQLTQDDAERIEKLQAQIWAVTDINGALVKALELYVRQEPGPQYAGPYVHPSKILSTAQAALRAARGES